MNALEFIDSYEVSESISNKLYPKHAFVSLNFNGIDLWIVYDKQTMKPLMFNLTKLSKQLKGGVKTTSSSYSFVIHNREQLESRPEYFEVKGKGTRLYCGWYASLKCLDRISFAIASFNGSDWFDGVTDWYGDMYYGHVYLVQPPEYSGTNVFKLGKAGQTEREMKQRWTLYINKAGEDGSNGLDILGLVAVKNTSEAEGALKQFYRVDNRIRFLLSANGKDTEYFEVMNCNPEEAGDIVIDIFKQASEKFRRNDRLQHCEEPIQIFESGTNVFHYKSHKRDMA